MFTSPYLFLLKIEIVFLINFRIKIYGNSEEIIIEKWHNIIRNVHNLWSILEELFEKSRKKTFRLETCLNIWSIPSIIFGPFYMKWNIQNIWSIIIGFKKRGNRYIFNIIFELISISKIILFNKELETLTPFFRFLRDVCTTNFGIWFDEKIKKKMNSLLIMVVSCRPKWT